MALLAFISSTAHSLLAAWRRSPLMALVVMKPSGMPCFSLTLQTSPPSFPFLVQLFCVSLIITSRSPLTEDLILLQQTFQTGVELLQTNLTDERFPEKFGRWRSQVSAFALPPWLIIIHEQKGENTVEAEQE